MSRAAEPFLSVESLSVAIEKTDILRAISLEVSAGEMVALIGHNGSGKTTLLRSLMGILPAKSGAIRVAGQQMTDRPAHIRARAGVGYMPEDRRLIPTLSVEENILMPSWSLGLPDAAKRLAAIYDDLPEVAAAAKRPALTLSGGQQKLAALARALMVGDRLLLLDEPFEGVAPALLARLHEVIAHVGTATRAVLICDSSLDRERDLYSRVLILERGAIAG